MRRKTNTVSAAIDKAHFATFNVMLNDVCMNTFGIGIVNQVHAQVKSPVSEQVHSLVGSEVNRRSHITINKKL